MELSPRERERYARHLVLPDFGKAAQLRLKSARVLVVGAGGLGSPVLQYLAAAGVGTIGIVDPDRVSAGNLQRQVLYGERDLGRLKVEVARERLLDLNPHLCIQTYPVFLTKNNCEKILDEYDIIADGTDNFPTRYLVNDACVLLGKTNVYASVFRFEGQVSVFNHPEGDGKRGPNYRDLYPVPPLPDQVPDCATGGVLGVLPGIVGTLQANEVIKLITGMGEPLIGRVAIFDALTVRQHVIRFSARPETKIGELIDYAAFCGAPAVESLPAIEAAVLKAMLERNDDFLLLDVREPAEYAVDNLGGQLLPLAELPTTWQQLSPARTIIVHCQSGARSAKAVALLRDQGFQQVYNLTGGISAYRALD